MSDCHAPVLFIVFNRSDTALQVLKAIADARPSRLYIAADGPRPHRPGEQAITEEVRQAVLSEINWPCEVKTLFQPHNLGCRHGVRAAIDWFFANEEEGIILEDDVVPSPDFFAFCHYALKAYRNQDRVFMVSGTNPLGAGVESQNYFYSSFGGIWGWASWRRAWAKYDAEMSSWPDPAMSKAFRKNYGPWTARYLCSVFDNHLKYDIDTWDSQWTYSLLKHGGLAIVPVSNLIRNIGIVGTHSSVETRSHNLSYGKLRFPLEPIAKEIEEDHTFRARMTREIYAQAMLISEASRIAKRFGIHDFIKYLYNFGRSVSMKFK